MKSVFLEHLDGWVTGIATCFLAYFTFTLRAEARRQAEKDRPFLALSMEQSLDYGSWERYPFRADDAAHQQLAMYQTDFKNPKFVNLRITNEQTTVTGIASDILIDAEMLFGVNDNVSAYPYVLKRSAAIPVVGANKYVEGRFLMLSVLTTTQYE